jgi:hypothetical protein
VRELRDSASCAYAKYTRLTITRHLRVCTESVYKPTETGRAAQCGNGSLTASIPLIVRLCTEHRLCRRWALGRGRTLHHCC